MFQISAITTTRRMDLVRRALLRHAASDDELLGDESPRHARYIGPSAIAERSARGAATPGVTEPSHFDQLCHRAPTGTNVAFRRHRSAPLRRR